MRWYIKVIRSGARFSDGSLPAEVWKEGGVCPTLNAFDIGDTRTAVIVFASHMVDGARVQTGNTLNTMSAHMGTGGNNVPMVAYSIREDAKANTFSATETDTALALQGLQPSPQSHHAQIFIAEEAEPNVRRLTPLECERLQGFPDDWTDGQADSHRYKQMGNAVTVNVTRWIGERLNEA